MLEFTNQKFQEDFHYYFGSYSTPFPFEKIW